MKSKNVVVIGKQNLFILFFLVDSEGITVSLTLMIAKLLTNGSLLNTPTSQSQ